MNNPFDQIDRSFYQIAEDRMAACREMSGHSCPACGTLQIMYISHTGSEIRCKCRHCRHPFILERKQR